MYPDVLGALFGGEILVNSRESTMRDRLIDSIDADHVSQYAAAAVTDDRRGPR